MIFCWDREYGIIPIKGRPPVTKSWTVCSSQVVMDCFGGRKYLTGIIDLSPKCCKKSTISFA